LEDGLQALGALVAICDRICEIRVAEERFVAAVGLCSDLELEPSLEGVVAATEEAERFFSHPSSAGLAFEPPVQALEPHFPDNQLTHLILKVSQMPEARERVWALRTLLIIPASRALAQHVPWESIADAFIGTRESAPS
jgi:hypothetical protein